MPAEATMLDFPAERRFQMCDGLGRRDFLRLGALGVGGLTLADLLRLRAQGGASGDQPHKAVIMVLLRGGPSHIDTFDPKPGAPSDIRGPFKPIATNVPGIQVSEILPLQAKIMDRLAIVRNVRFGVDAHNGIELLTGHAVAAGSAAIRAQVGLPPAFGSVLSRLQQTWRNNMPPYVSLLESIQRSEAPEDPSWLGAAHRPFYFDGKHVSFFGGQTSAEGAGLNSLRLASGMTLERLEDRKAMLGSFDSLRRDLDDEKHTLDGMDTFTRRALEMISSDRARKAFDLGREPDKVRDKYGKDLTGLLLARRLVEAGVSMVTVGCSIAAASDRTAFWDIHGGGAGTVEKAMPILGGLLDRGIHALVTDLRERGLEQDVAVVAWGEMGRTPKINNGGGRDHWPAAGCALLAGGGLRTGQVVGGTTSRGETPVGRPYTPRDVLATLYHVLGIDPGAITIPDFSGRPRYLLEDSRKISELL
jgi:Protein of unknown function (DUF1501)